MIVFRPRRWSATAAVAAAAMLATSARCESPPAVAGLVAQLEGRHCRYRAEYDRCTTAPLLSWDLLLEPRRHSCVYWAARCLERLGPAAGAAVPALAATLRDGPNDFDTGDGTIGARSAVAGALAAIGDPAAVPALVYALEHARPYDRAAITGALASAQPAARPAIIAALVSFGPSARPAAPALAAVLRERNADFAYNRHAAARISELEASFPPPPERARRLYFNDQLAEAAAAALGAVGAAEELALLVASLDNRGAARGAAEGLGRLGTAARPAAPRLRTLLADPAYQADARIATAQALAAIGDAGAVPAIAAGLESAELVDGYLSALAAFGPAADPAAPALAVLVSTPSGVVRDGRSIAYDVRASQIHHRRMRAIDTLGSIGGEQAFSVLARALPDPEIGAGACRALQRLDPEGARIRAVVARLTESDLAAYRESRFQINPCIDRRR